MNLGLGFCHFGIQESQMVQDSGLQNRQLVFRGLQSQKMASLLVKRSASDLLRVRTISSSSRLFSTKGYEFAVHDTKDECILKCDDRLGSSAAHRFVKLAFSPYVSPTGNLARVLNLLDFSIGHVHGTHVFSRWSVVEDDKAIYILRDRTAKDIEDVRESVKKFVTENHDKNFIKHVLVSEEEYSTQIDPGNAFPIIDIMRGDEYAPTGDYYYHVMKDVKEVKQFVDSLYGTPDTVINASIKMYGVPNKPQALYILLVLGDKHTGNLYGGYAMEIFLDNTLYSFYDIKPDLTDVNSKLFIPKKKVEATKAIGGNLIFFQEKKFIK